MTTRSMEDLMESLSRYHDVFDVLSRTAHEKYMSYEAAVRLEHDVRAQASCTYCHMVAEADRQFLDDENIITKDIRGLKLWIFKDQDIVVRFKKLDEQGLKRNNPTRQQKDFDNGKELPGLPFPPERLTVGYLLDSTGTIFERTQIAKPAGSKSVDWCAAIVPVFDREDENVTWIDVTRQRRATF